MASHSVASPAAVSSAPAARSPAPKPLIAVSVPHTSASHEYAVKNGQYLSSVWMEHRFPRYQAR